MSVTDTERWLHERLEIDMSRCTLTYGVAPCTATGGTGNECYNTFVTCHDRANYTPGVHTYRFIRRGNPPILDGVHDNARPYILSIQRAPTEIEIGKGLSARGKVTIKLADEPDNDTEQDPYHATRPAPAGGTFWSRFLARHDNYLGRPARLNVAWPRASQRRTPGTAYAEYYVIDAIRGPDKEGTVTIVLKDPLKRLDRVDVPSPSKGELAAAITSSDTSFTLKSGQGADYATSGYVRIGDEVIAYDARDADTFSGLTRAQFGTTATDHRVSTLVQQCKVYLGQPVHAVIKDLLNSAGIVDDQIDLTALQAESDDWLTPWSITVCLAEPMRVSQLLDEIVFQTMSVLWWDPVAGKVRFLALRPLSLDESATSLDEEADLISASIDRLDEQRMTRVAVYYGLRAATVSRMEPKNYLRGLIKINTDLEGVNGLNTVREKLITARWLDVDSDNAAGELQTRAFDLYTNTQHEITCLLDPKDSDVRVGGYVDLTVRGLESPSGQPKTTRCLVTRRVELGDRIEVRLLALSLSAIRRYAWIHSDAAPDYGVATEEQRKMAYFSNDSGFMPDDTIGYAIL